ncbi:MAG: hypothetical protein KGV51_01175 [Moraxellaceae bacterium]|nr:hypothetical protein [Moraxellaceae bacterium]
MINTKDFDDYPEITQADIDRATFKVQGKTVDKSVWQQAVKQATEKKTKALDDDVIDWISTQDSATRNYINGMIRNYMSFKNETMKAVS